MKELIKKYKVEFDHWLNGGDIIVAFTNGGWVKSSLFDWAKKDLDCDIKYIVINDEYVEFRKALAEGKTVQAKDDLSSTKYNNLITPIWFDLPVECYRIKQEEPQFKVGDWVLFDGRATPVRLTKKHLDSLPNYIFYDVGIGGIDYPLEDVKLWEPQPGEWCWFWNNDKQPFLAQLDSIEDNEYVTVQGLHGSYADLSDACFLFEYCQPFIGELPTILQQPE